MLLFYGHFWKMKHPFDIACPGFNPGATDLWPTGLPVRQWRLLYHSQFGLKYEHWMICRIYTTPDSYQSSAWQCFYIPCFLHGCFIHILELGWKWTNSSRQKYNFSGISIIIYYKNIEIKPIIFKLLVAACKICVSQISIIINIIFIDPFEHQ